MGLLDDVGTRQRGPPRRDCRDASDERVGAQRRFCPGLLRDAGRAGSDESRLPARGGRRTGAGFAAVAAAVYVAGCIVPTVVFNVPLNEALAAAPIPEATDAATELWDDYSTRWQFWNQLRAIAAGIALLTVGYGLLVRAR